MQVDTERRLLGTTGLSVSPVCVGGAPLGSAPQNFGYEVGPAKAYETVRAVLDSGVNFLDTSNSYGGGESEKRVGAVVAERGGLPAGFVLATKADRDASGDFSAARVRRSAEESLGRLGLDHFSLYYLHDPEFVSFKEATGPGGAVEAMVALRDEGIAQHIGVAGGPVGLLIDYLRLGVFEVVLTHNRFTLVDQSALPLLDVAAEMGLGVVNAAVHGGGILARGPSYTDRYAYRVASSEVIGRITAMEERCRQYSVPLRTAALQFSLREPRISSTVVGVSSAGHVAELVEMASVDVPEELFKELAPLAAPQDQWLG
jgi:D-threo-aldose 1-dehydrogenase